MRQMLPFSYHVLLMPTDIVGASKIVLSMRTAINKNLMTDCFLKTLENSNTWPELTIGNLLPLTELGFLQSYPLPKPYAASIFMSFSRLSWMLIVLYLFCITFVLALAHLIYLKVAPQMIASVDFVNIVMFKTWLGMTQAPMLNLFTKKSISGIILFLDNKHLQ